MNQIEKTKIKSILAKLTEKFETEFSNFQNTVSTSDLKRIQMIIDSYNALETFPVESEAK
ncbi:MAG: hypothetical protein WC554_14825 [Clostridia bacterium]|jgi:hypothetical protein